MRRATGGGRTPSSGLVRCLALRLDTHTLAQYSPGRRSHETRRAPALCTTSPRLPSPRARLPSVRHETTPPRSRPGRVARRCCAGASSVSSNLVARSRHARLQRAHLHPLCRSLIINPPLQAATYVPRQPPIAFFWETGNNSVKTIPQCSALQIFTVRSPTTNVQPTGPLYFTAAAPGYDPETQLVASDVDESFTWIADFPVVRSSPLLSPSPGRVRAGRVSPASRCLIPQGTQLLFAMTDSANNSGGAVGGCAFAPPLHSSASRRGARANATCSCPRHHHPWLRELHIAWRGLALYPNRVSRRQAV